MAGAAAAKFAYIKQLPYLLCFCDKQEFAAQCVKLYEAVTDSSQHHRVTLNFLGAGSAWRDHIYNCGASGVCHPDLLSVQLVQNTGRLITQTILHTKF
jgi:hypothetical protein